MMADTHVACIGEAMVELSLDRAAPDTARLGVAGDTLNTAIYLKRSAPGLRVSFVTRIGTDEFSDRMLAAFRAEDLDVTHVGRDPARLPGLYAISTDAAGERSFSYWRGASAARRLFDGTAPALADLSGAGLVYYSAISLAILSEAAREALLVWLAGYRSAGGCVAFDSNYRPALWADRAEAARWIEAAWRVCDVGLPSVDDEIAVFGDPDAEAVLARLRGFGIAAGALKRGADGPLAIDGTPCGPFAPAAAVVDSTAAGDSFNGAYLAALLAGQPERACLAAGHDLAARVIGARGAILPRTVEPEVASEQL